MYETPSQMRHSHEKVSVDSHSGYLHPSRLVKEIAGKQQP